MQMQIPRLTAFSAVSLTIVGAMLFFSIAALADPPSRVARIGYLSGAVSLSPAGEDDWVQAAINRPLTTGDRVWTDAGARAEVQIGGAMIRMNAGTGLAILNLDDGIAQLQLSQGSLNVRVRRLAPDQAFEIDTPNLALTFRQPGEFRIDVDADGNATTIVVRKGRGEVYGADAAYVVDARQPFRFAGTGLREYYDVDAPRADEFDRWSVERDYLYDNSASARYVSPDVVGYQDLDANGTWRVDASYGNVWIPNRVSAGWAPYRDGHWAWVDPWGWTWIDDAPWGFAVSHYGRWAYMGGTWGWVPGPVRDRAYYAPALVAFVGGSNFQIAIGSGNVGGVGLVPARTARSVSAVVRGQPRLFRERQPQQHGRQQHRHQQLLQQRERDQRHVRESAGARRRRRRSGERIRAVAAGRALGGRTAAGRNRERPGRLCACRRADAAKRARRRRPRRPAAAARIRAPGRRAQRTTRDPRGVRGAATATFRTARPPARRHRAQVASARCGGAGRRQRDPAHTASAADETTAGSRGR